MKSSLKSDLGGADAPLPLENARFIEELERQERILRKQQEAGGELLPVHEVARRLQVSVQAINKALSAQRMFSLEVGQKRKLVPSFFTASDLNRQDVEAVNQVLGALPGGVKWQFFTTPKLSLQNRTPLDALRAGELPQVLRAAEGYLER